MIDRFFHIQKGVFMNILKYKGKRIRASDKNLVYRFCVGTLLLLFVAVLLLLNMGQLMRTDWEHFSLLDNGLTLSTYNFITIGIATGVCALVAFLYYRFFHDWSYVKKKYKLNMPFLSWLTLPKLLLFRLTLHNTPPHIELAKDIHNDCGSALYYKMFLYIRIPVYMHAGN